MTTELGTELGTTLGTILASMETDGSPVFDASKMYTLGSISSANYYATQAAGGEPGTPPFGFAVLAQVAALSGTNSMIAHRSTSAYTGWQLWQSAAHVVQVFAALSGGTLAASPSRTLTASDAGKIVLIIGYIDASFARHLWFDRLEVGSGTAAASYLAASTAQMLGMSYAANPATGYRPIAHFTFQGAPSAAQFQALYDAARTAGDLPATFPGATITHRWSLRDTLQLANVSVNDNAAAPASIPDSVTSASADAMAKVGSPVVRVIDPATPRLWSYETSPIYRGAGALTQTAYFVSTFDDPTVAGQSFYNAYLYWVPAVTQAAASVAGANALAAPNTGWDLRFGANNATANWFIGDGAAFNTSSNAVLATGKLNLIVCVWDQAALRQRIYANRAEVGTGQTRTAYAPTGAGTKIQLGFSPRDAGLGTGARALLGFAQGLGAPSLAQVQALFDAVVSNETMQGVPGMTSTLVDLTLDIAGNGGAIPASLPNRAGSGSFTRTGAPTVTPIYARTYSW